MEKGFWKNYKSHILFSGLILGFVLVFYFAGEIILPFIIGLIGAAAFNPVIKKIQKIIPSRNLAVSTFLILIVGLFAGSMVFFGSLVVKDLERFNNAFVVFADNNSEGIDEITNEVKTYINKIYSEVNLEKVMEDTKMDSIGLNTESIASSLSKITSFFSSDGETGEVDRSYNWLVIILYAIGYFIAIIYSYEYFVSRYDRYFGGNKRQNKYLKGIINDFNVTFTTYFVQRSKVVFISTILFIACFLIIGIPGAIILGVIAGLLCYISHFHFITLIPLSLSCWALSIEQDQSFLLFFGLVVALFIIVSILEEMVFFPKIMKGVSNMNPAIMLISFVFWGAVFGTVGLVIALPLTTMVLLYLDRLLRSKELKEVTEGTSLET